MAKILIVDDENICTMMLAIEFTDCGHLVRTASDGREAVEIGKEFNPDLLVTDWRLEGEMDGKDVILRLRELNEKIIVFICSGLPIEYFHSESKTFSHFFKKPIDPDALLSRANEMLRAYPEIKA